MWLPGLGSAASLPRGSGQFPWRCFGRGRGVEVLHPSAHSCAEWRVRGPLHSPSLAIRTVARSEEARQKQEMVLGWGGPCRGGDYRGPEGSPRPLQMLRERPSASQAGTHSFLSDSQRTYGRSTLWCFGGHTQGSSAVFPGQLSSGRTSRLNVGRILETGFPSAMAPA